MNTKNNQNSPELARAEQPAELTRRAMLGYAAAAGAALTVGSSAVFAQEAVPGIDPATKTITIGAFTPVTGPVPFYALISHGADAYFKHLNDNGGIQGWKFNYILKDDGYEPSRSVAAARRLVEDDKIFALVASIGTAQNIAVIPYAKSVNIPVVSPVGGSPKLVAEPNIFPLLPDYALSGSASAEFAINDLKKKKIALLWVNDEVGRGAKRGIDLYLSSQKLETAVATTFDYSTADFSPHVRRAAEANAEVVILFGSNANLAGALRAADKQGYKADWIAPFFTADPATYSLAKSLLDGVYFSSWLLPVDSDDESVKQYRAALQKYYPRDPIGIFGLNGWTSAALFGVAFEKMLKANMPLTRESLVEALNSIKNEKVGGVKTVTFSKEDHRGIRQETMIQAKDGKYVSVRDYTPYPEVVFNANPG